MMILGVNSSYRTHGGLTSSSVQWCPAQCPGALSAAAPFLVWLYKGTDLLLTLPILMHEFIVSSKSAFFSFIGTSANSFPINSPD